MINQVNYGYPIMEIQGKLNNEDRGDNDVDYFEIYG